VVGRTAGMGESQEELQELQVEVSAGDQDKMEAESLVMFISDD
jgi:hypothetical protein